MKYSTIRSAITVLFILSVSIYIPTYLDDKENAEKGSVYCYNREISKIRDHNPGIDYDMIFKYENNKCCGYYLVDGKIETTCK